MTMSMPSRNAPCPCGSGKKFKVCYQSEACTLDGVNNRRDPIPFIIAALGIVAGGIVMNTEDVESGLATMGVGLMIAIAYGLFRNPPSSKGGGDPGAINFGG